MYEVPETVSLIGVETTATWYLLVEGAVEGAVQAICTVVKLVCTAVKSVTVPLSAVYAIQNGE